MCVLYMYIHVCTVHVHPCVYCTCTSMCVLYMYIHVCTVHVATTEYSYMYAQKTQTDEAMQ